MTRLTIIIVVLYIKQLLATENFTAASEIMNPLVLSGGSASSCVSPEARQMAIEALENEVRKNTSLHFSITIVA